MKTLRIPAVIITEQSIPSIRAELEHPPRPPRSGRDMATQALAECDSCYAVVVIPIDATTEIRRDAERAAAIESVLRWIRERSGL